jgi:hypothetical protein
MFEQFLQAHLSRRTLFKAAGAAGVGIWLAQAGLLQEAAAASDTVQDVLNITVTVEHFGVTFLGYGIDNIMQGKFSKPVPPVVLAVLQAARAQEQFHLDFFAQAGGKPLTTTFTLPDPALVTDYDMFFTALVQEETRETALGIAAMDVFTAMQRPDLVKVIFQYAAEESEHRLLANYALGARPANDRAFAQALYANPSDIVTDLQNVGIIGGTGPAITYPGPGTIDPTNVIERIPGGPMVDCAAPAPSASPMPSASPTPMPMPGLPNTGGGGGAADGQGTIATFGAIGLGVAAMSAIARRRSRMAHAPAPRDER